MAELRYDADSDVYTVTTVNVINDAPNDVGPRYSDGYDREEELREEYPLLCQRYLDGYSAEQVARGRMWSMAKYRIEFDIELYSLRRDARSSSGPAHILLTMADGRR